MVMWRVMFRYEGKFKTFHFDDLQSALFEFLSWVDTVGCSYASIAFTKKNNGGNE